MADEAHVIPTALVAGHRLAEERIAHVTTVLTCGVIHLVIDRRDADHIGAVVQRERVPVARVQGH